MIKYILYAVAAFVGLGLVWDSSICLINKYKRKVTSSSTPPESRSDLYPMREMAGDRLDAIEADMKMIKTSILTIEGLLRKQSNRHYDMLS